MILLPFDYLIYLKHSHSGRMTNNVGSGPTDPLPASVTQLDVHATGDQELTGSTSAWSATFFHGN